MKRFKVNCKNRLQKKLKSGLKSLSVGSMIGWGGVGWGTGYHCYSLSLFFVAPNQGQH